MTGTQCAAERAQGRRLGAVVLAASALVVACGGCISGSLATSTGPRAQGPWSVAPKQYAHVGEEVLFDFVLSKPFAKRPLDPTGIADYCVLNIGNARLITEPDFDGHFRFSHTLRNQQPGTTVKAAATAYRAMGQPDHVMLAGRWIDRQSPTDGPDPKVAGDSIRLILYQAQIVLEVEPTSAPLDFASGRLQIRKADGSTISIYEDRPHRRGFTTTGPTDDRYHVTYIPRGDELNPIGATDVEFTVYDQTGRRHTVSATLDTP